MCSSPVITETTIICDTLVKKMNSVGPQMNVQKIFNKKMKQPCDLFKEHFYIGDVQKNDCVFNFYLLYLFVSA